MALQLARAFHIINKRQQAWARDSGIPLDRNCSTSKLAENLFRPLRPQTQQEFASADGSELDGKMKKLYSSSALAANVFDYWRESPRRAGACFDLPATASMSFEKNRSIFDGVLPEDPKRKNPNIDVELAAVSPSPLIALECKFTEPFVKYPQTKPPFTSTYFRPDAEPIWSEMEATRALAIRLNDQPVLFTRLDAAQLIKIALAYKQTVVSGRWRLVYVWFNVTGDQHAEEECRVLSEELNLFQEQIRGEIPLEALTWQEVFLRLASIADPADSSYIAYLCERYFQYL